MTKTTVVYRDVTQNPDATGKANHGPALRDALITAGFTHVGLLEVRVPNLLTPACRQQLMNSSDGILMLDLLENGEITEILTSPDQRAFASVERYFGGPVVCIRTILEDGVIVETSTRPKRAPQLSTPSEATDNQISKLVQWLLRIARGEPALWPRQNWPRAGYYLTLIDTDDAQVIWQHHRQQVDGLLDNSNRALRAHITVPLFIGINQRTLQIMEYKARWQGYLTYGIATMIILLMLGAGELIIFPTLTITSTPFFDTIAPFLLILPYVATVFTGMLAFVLIRAMSPTIVFRLRGPKVQLVSELLSKIG